MMQIRCASPNDAYFLAKAILIAGRSHVTKGIWEVILGGTEDECLSFIHHLSTTQITRLFHYSYYIIAGECEFPIGTLGGYDPRISGYRSGQKSIPEVAQTLNLPPQGTNLSERASKILSCLQGKLMGHGLLTASQLCQNIESPGMISLVKDLK